MLPMRYNPQNNRKIKNRDYARCQNSNWVIFNVWVFLIFYQKSGQRGDEIRWGVDVLMTFPPSYGKCWNIHVNLSDGLWLYLNMHGSWKDIY